MSTEPDCPWCYDGARSPNGDGSCQACGGIMAANRHLPASPRRITAVDRAPGGDDPKRVQGGPS